MAEVTIRGRISNTFLDVGQEIRVERTTIVDAMIEAGHIDLVEIHEDPKPVEVKRRGKSRASSSEPQETVELSGWPSFSGSGQIHETDDGGSEEIGTS